MNEGIFDRRHYRAVSETLGAIQSIAVGRDERITDRRYNGWGKGSLIELDRLVQMMNTFVSLFAKDSSQFSSESFVEAVADAEEHYTSLTQ